MKNIVLLLILSVIIISCGEQKTNKEQDKTAVVTDTTADAKRIEELNSLLATNPFDAALLHERSQLYIKRHEFSKALPDAMMALKLDSTKADYFVTMSDLQMAANKPSQAKKSLEKSLQLDPDNSEAHMKIAELFFIAKQYDKVFLHINAVLKKDAHRAPAYMMKGMAYKEMGDTAKAVSSFQTAVEQDPQYYAPLMQLGIIYAEKNDQAALQYYNRALALNPASEEALYGRAMWYQENVHDFDKAIQDYTSMIQLNPENKYAHFNLGYLHFQYLKVYNQAIKHYTDAINIDPSYAEAYYNRGLAYETSGDVSSAKKDYEEAIKIRPDYLLARQGLERVNH
jgi:tetratricopeptide (TPR) repeat protein